MNSYYIKDVPMSDLFTYVVIYLRDKYFSIWKEPQL